MKKFVIFTVASLVSFAALSKSNIDFSYKQEKSTNNQPNWHSFNTTYTQKENNDYWQISFNQHERYNLKDEDLSFTLFVCKAPT